MSCAYHISAAAPRRGALHRARGPWPAARARAQRRSSSQYAPGPSRCAGTISPPLKSGRGASASDGPRAGRAASARGNAQRPRVPCRMDNGPACPAAWTAWRARARRVHRPQPLARSGISRAFTHLVRHPDPTCRCCGPGRASRLTALTLAQLRAGTALARAHVPGLWMTRRSTSLPRRTSLNSTSRPWKPATATLGQVRDRFTSKLARGRCMRPAPAACHARERLAWRKRTFWSGAPRRRWQRRVSLFIALRPGATGRAICDTCPRGRAHTRLGHMTVWRSPAVQVTTRSECTNGFARRVPTCSHSMRDWPPRHQLCAEPVLAI